MRIFEKTGGALRYVLIGALELAKSAREAREGGKTEGVCSGRRERGNDFGVIFKAFFFK